MSGYGWSYLSAEDRESLLRSIASGRAEAGPFHVELHPADRCNIECFFCSTAVLRGTDEVPLNRVQELIGEFNELGVRSIRLAGGGEPLFHRKTADLLGTIRESNLRIENVTTNAVLMNGDVADHLLECCDEVTISLNTIGEESYSSMMQTPGRIYGRVLGNVRSFMVERRRRKGSKTVTQLQFLVWKENYLDIEKMYELGVELGVDKMYFNGLSFLTPDKMMSAEERREMLATYETLIERDGFRRISSIASFENDIYDEIIAIRHRVDAKRKSRGAWEKARRFLDRSDFSITEKLQYRFEMSSKTPESDLADLTEDCIIGFYSMLVRPSGDVAPCCIIQGKKLGNIYEQSVRDVWFGEEYQQFREELSRLLRMGPDWVPDPERDRTVEPICGGYGVPPCPIRSYYYRQDPEFARRLTEIVRDASPQDVEPRLLEHVR